MEIKADTLEIEKTIAELQDKLNGEGNNEVRNGLLIALGNAYLLLSDRKDVKKNLVNALLSFEQAERVYSSMGLDKYGTIENMKGFIFFKLAFLKDRNKNLRMAIEHYKKALKFRTKEASPYKYASTQYNVGNAYLSLRDGSKRANILEAVRHFEDALSVRKERKNSAEYGIINNALGLSYLMFSEISSDAKEIPDFLNKAISYFGESSRIFTFEPYPLDYAMIQNNLGVCFSKLAGSGIEKEKNLQTSIRHYVNALRIYKIEKFPKDYGTTQYNLGVSYHNLAKTLANIERKEMLYNAEKRIKYSLEVFLFDEHPDEFARSKYNLGVIYNDLYSIEKDRKILLEEISCFKDALKVFTEDKNPFTYGTAEFYIAQAFYLLNDRVSALKHYVEAERVTALFDEKLAGNLHKIVEQIRKA